MVMSPSVGWAQDAENHSQKRMAPRTAASRTQSVDPGRARMDRASRAVKPVLLCLVSLGPSEPNATQVGPHSLFCTDRYINRSGHRQGRFLYRSIFFAMQQSAGDEFYRLGHMASVVSTT